MTVGRRKMHASNSKPASTAALCALLLAASTATTSALSLWGSGSTAESDDEPSSYSADNNFHQAPSDPLPGQDVNSFGQPTYGVDVSFPIHHEQISDNYAWLPHNVDPSLPTPPEHAGKPIQYLGKKRDWYEDFLEGCDDYYGGGGEYSACRITEQDRVAMSLRQPQAMQNYTELGFKKIRAPKAVWEQISKFWEENKGKENWKNENWPSGNTYTNHVSHCFEGIHFWP